MHPPRRSRSLPLVFAAVAVGLATIPSVAVAVIGDVSAESMADELVAARGHTILNQVQRRLDTTRRSKEAFAQLLAADPAVIAATASADEVALAQVLVPARARLDIQEIDVLDRDGVELLHLSPHDDRHFVADLRGEARAGITSSRADLVAEGLLVQAAAPIKDGTGIIGVLVAGRLFDEQTLSDLAGGEDVLLALYHDGHPTYIPEDVAVALAEEASRPAEGAVVDHFLSTPLELAPGDTLLALVDITDILAARRERRYTLLLGGGVLAFLAAIIGLMLTRRLSRPFTGIISVARSIAEGQYDERVPANRFTEIDAVGEAINQLAGAVETRIELLSRAQAEIRYSLESKDQLVASVSHELRTPLTAVVGYAEMLDDPDSGLSDADRAAMIHSIATEAMDLADIIEDLLVASRADTGQLAVITTSVDVVTEIEQVLGSLTEQASRKVVRFHPQPAVALADPGRVRQVLRNLITNAVRYGGDTITISCETCDGLVKVAVADNGPQIPPDLQARIFEPYQRAHHRPGLTSSVGLGLTISRQLARLMDGDLTFESTEGTTFTFTVPCASVAATAARSEIG